MTSNNKKKRQLGIMSFLMEKRNTIYEGSLLTKRKEILPRFPYLNINSKEIQGAEKHVKLYHGDVISIIRLWQTLQDNLVSSTNYKEERENYD